MSVTWTVILFTTLIVAPLVGVAIHDEITRVRVRNQQQPRLTGSRLTRVLEAHNRAEAELRLGDAMRHAGHPMPSLGMAPGHTWPGDCLNCVWWIPAASEAEDAIAVYQPCPQHDPVLWAEFERKYAES